MRIAADPEAIRKIGGSGDTYARADGDRLRGHRISGGDPERWLAKIVAVERSGNPQGGTEVSRSTHQGRGGGTPATSHRRVQSLHWTGCANQHRRGISELISHGVQAPVNSVNSIDIGDA